MIIIGITGSIAMGKTTIAKMLENRGIPTHSADTAVHSLLGPGGRAVEPVRAAFPNVKMKEGGIDRSDLSKIIFADDSAREKLELILHPLVGVMHDEFIGREKTRGTRMISLDIPLLFETGGDRRVDYTLVVTAPYSVQRARAMKRPGMTEEKFQAILRRQMPDADKRRRADFVINTGFGLFLTQLQLRHMLSKIKQTRA